jgi:predicted small lipoprotein YifL
MQQRRSSVVGKIRDTTQVAFALAALGLVSACGLKGPLVQAQPAEAASAAAIAASSAPPR